MQWHAATQCSGLDLAPHGFIVAAGFGGVRATGPEAATRRGVHGRRHVAFEDHALALALDVWVRDGTAESRAWV